MMTQLDDPQFDSMSVAAVLALLGHASTDELLSILTLLDCKPIGKYLTQDFPISRADFVYWLDQEYAVRLLDDLQANDLVFFRHLCAVLLDWLIAQQQAGKHSREIQLAHVLNVHATHLMQESASAFQTLIERIESLALHEPALLHLRSYFGAVLFARQDRYSEAIERLIDLLRDPSLDAELGGRALNSQAIYLQLTGRLEQAVEGYNASLALWQRLGNRKRQGMALLNLGILHYQLQEYTPAEERLLAAGDCFLATNNEYQLASVQNQLGLLYRDQGLLDEALVCFDAVAAQRRAIADWDSLGRALNNRGEVRLFQGRLDEAEVDFVEALGKMQSRTFAIDGYVNLGLARQVRGDLAGAQQMFQHALAIAEAIGRRDILSEIYYRLGDASRRLGDAEQTLRHLEAAADVVESGQRDIRNEQLRIGLLGRWQQIYEALVLHCVQLGKIEQAFVWAERARARTFAEALARRHSSEISQAGWDRPEHMQLATPAQLQAALPAHSLLLSYFTIGVIEQEMPFLRRLPVDHALRLHLLLPAQTLCFSIDATGITLHNCALDPNIIATQSPRSDDRSRFFTPAVRQRLTKLLLPASVEHYQRLYLILHGPLHQVPCAALLDANQQSLLRSDGPALSYAPSATILWQQLQRQRPAPTQPFTCLAVGCDLDQDGVQLLHSEAEARWVAALFAGEALVGGQVKSQLLLSMAQKVGILHFACHGWFDPDDPLSSYLQTGNHERLRAQEILADWRLDVDLVTLSACQSGVQRLLRSDEPMGLVRAFLYAGAQAVLATQWPVDDLPTFLLMRNLYQQLFEDPTLPIADALRNAQCWLREVTVEELGGERALPMFSQDVFGADITEESAKFCPFAEPKFWAGFVLFD